MGCGRNPGRVVGEIGEALPVAEEARRFRGSAPIGRHDGAWESAGTTVGNRRPLRRGLQRGAMCGGTHGSRPTRLFFQGRPACPAGRVQCGRADVGSKLSAASGGYSEVSEWPRSKFPAYAVRQRRNFGHRNRAIGPYGCKGGGVYPYTRQMAYLEKAPVLAEGTCTRSRITAGRYSSHFTSSTAAVSPAGMVGQRKSKKSVLLRPV